MSGLREAASILGDRVERDVPLGPLTTYRVGGPAALFLEIASLDDLAVVQQAVAATGIAVLVVGKGSNLLVADAGFAGLAVTLGPAFATLTRPEPTVVRAGAAVALPVLARRTAAWALSGLEWAVGVPGSVGGAVRMNAGGHGSDVARTLRRCRLFDLAGPADPAAPDDLTDAMALALAYRSSSLRPTQLVVWAEFGLEPGDRDRSEAEIAEIVRWRREHQPGGQNAGSVFTNPPGESAGRLVEAAGLKGFRLGTAQVSPKHANFIQADPGGSADDVLTLIREVKRRVEQDSGVSLEPELRLIGFA